MTTYDSVEDVLDSSFTQELVSLSERDLNDSSELGEFFRSVGLEMTKTGQIEASATQSRARAHLDVGDTLKVGDEVLDESFPRLKSLNQNIGRSELVRTCEGVESIVSARSGPFAPSSGLERISLASSVISAPFRSFRRRLTSRLSVAFPSAVPGPFAEAEEGETAYPCSS